MDDSFVESLSGMLQGDLLNRAWIYPAAGSMESHPMAMRAVQYLAIDEFNGS
ncbi:MAG: hypothetical protein OSA98_14785 [Rubripirellula sp.]|nr:hypothetical protein [Rubripirellula sp.]